MTKEERHLWYDFLREYPVKFARQKVLGKYIADFYCAKANIVIELDGSQHYENDGIEYDKRRREFLNLKGLKILRFSNIDVENCFEGVCCEIDNVVRQSLPQSAKADSSLVRGSHE